MQAILFHKWGSASELQVAEVPKPEPGPEQLLVQIHYSSLNPIDFKIRNGRFRLFMNRKFPKIPGLEASGIVASIGERVTNFNAGDRVFVLTSRKFQMGCCATYIAVDADLAFLLPSDFDMKTGSALAVAPATALQGLRNHGLVRPGSRVLINGASGSVGQCAVQIARVLGADVTGVCSGRNTDVVKKAGANKVIDYTQTDFTTLPDRYDLVFDCVSSRSFGECRKVLTANGRYINLMLRPLDVLWQRIRNPFSQQKSITFIMKHRMDDLQWLVNCIQLGQLQVPIDTIFPIQQAPHAFERLESGRAVGKILLDVIS